MNTGDHWQTVERILIALFASVPPTIMATAALIAALRAYRQARVATARIDGRVDQLVQEAKERARLEGNLEAQANIVGALPAVRSGQDPLREHYLGPRPDLPPPPAAPR